MESALIELPATNTSLLTLKLPCISVYDVIPTQPACGGANLRALPVAAFATVISVVSTPKISPTANLVSCNVDFGISRIS